MCLPGVSLRPVPSLYSAAQNIPRLMTFFSAHHSPSTVNMNASEFVMGTVRLNSAFPINMKNHTLPVTLSSNGIAYAGRLRTPMTAYRTPRTFFLSHELFESTRAGRWGGV